MIEISRLNKEDIISLCQIIGNNDILVFLNKNNISTLKYKHDKSLQYSPAYYVIIERYQKDERVKSFLESRTRTLITKIIEDVMANKNNQSDAYYTLTAAINTRFHGNGKLFCKIIQENNLKEYSKKIKSKNYSSQPDSLQNSKISSELTKKIKELNSIISLRDKEVEKLKSEYEAKIVDLEGSKKKTDEALIVAEAEIAHLLKINKEYEEKATANNDTMLLSEKETLLTEIKHLEERKNELANDVKQIEEEHTQLIAKRIQLQNKLDDEIKRFSDDFAHSTAISAIIQKLNQTSTAKGSATSILIELPESNIPNATHEEELLLVTDILADNLFAAGIQKNNDELAKVLISTIIGKGNFIIYGSGQENIADAVSLALFAECAAHVVLPTDISNIPYFINEINGIQRSVVYIENALDSFSDRLCNSLIKHSKDKIFVFAVNDHESLRSIKGSFVFEKCLYLNSELFTDYLAKPDYKANKCNLSLYQEDPDVFTRIIENDYVKQLVKIIGVSPSVYRFWIRIAANYGNKYNTKFRRNIVVELITSIMIKDGLCSGTIENLRNYVNENEDTKLDLLDTIIAEDTEDESD